MTKYRIEIHCKINGVRRVIQNFLHLKNHLTYNELVEKEDEFIKHLEEIYREEKFEVDSIFTKEID